VLWESAYRWSEYKDKKPWPWRAGLQLPPAAEAAYARGMISTNHGRQSSISGSSPTRPVPSSSAQSLSNAALAREWQEVRGLAMEGDSYARRTAIFRFSWRPRGVRGRSFGGAGASATRPLRGWTGYRAGSCHGCRFDVRLRGLDLMSSGLGDLLGLSLSLLPIMQAAAAGRRNRGPPESAALVTGVDGQCVHPGRPCESYTEPLAAVAADVAAYLLSSTSQDRLKTFGQARRNSPRGTLLLVQAWPCMPRGFRACRGGVLRGGRDLGPVSTVNRRGTTAPL